MAELWCFRVRIQVELQSSCFWVEELRTEFRFNEIRDTCSCFCLGAHSFSCYFRLARCNSKFGGLSYHANVYCNLRPIFKAFLLVKPAALYRFRATAIHENWSDCRPRLLEPTVFRILFHECPCLILFRICGIILSVTLMWGIVFTLDGTTIKYGFACLFARGSGLFRCRTFLQRTMVHVSALTFWYADALMLVAYNLWLLIPMLHVSGWIELHIVILNFSTCNLELPVIFGEQFVCNHCICYRSQTAKLC